MESNWASDVIGSLKEGAFMQLVFLPWHQAQSKIGSDLGSCFHRDTVSGGGLFLAQNGYDHFGAIQPEAITVPDKHELLI